VITQPRSAVRPAPPQRTRHRRNAPKEWWGDAASAAGKLSVLVVVGLWAANHGISDLTRGTGPALTSAGRLVGLVAMDLLIIQVILMARIPLIERTWGQDRLARWHRLVGFTSFNGMLAHIALVTLGYAASARVGILAEFWELITNAGGMLLALAATVCIIGVVVTSMRFARRKLRYESWHLLHLYAYLGVGLALPHEIWTGSSFRSSWAQVYWWGFWGLAMAAVVVYRIVQPLWRSARHQLRVVKIIKEAPGVVSVVVKGRDVHRLGARAGQFFQWRFLGADGWTRAHPYSLSAAPTHNAMRITVKALGDASSEMDRVPIGSRVLIEGPYGRLTADVCRGSGVTLVASGIGITPLRALLEELGPRPGGVNVIYRTSEGEDMIFAKELDFFAKEHGVRVVHLPGGRARRSSWLPSKSEHIADHAALLHLVPDIASHDVFVCGPNPWMDSVVTAASRCGVPDDQIHLERFDW